VDDFAASLDLLDECILLDIYPAREKPMEGVTSDWLMSKMKLKDKKVMTKQQVLDRVKESAPEVLVTMGAGDIDSLIEPLETILKK
jgi:UDP-N-acetylmuramate--alanine ligase